LAGIKPMADIEIYTTPLCPYCWRAKRLLSAKGVAFTEIDLWREPGRWPEMIERAQGRSTVPQIFVGGRGLGGCDDIHALDARGELDAILAVPRGHDGAASDAAEPRR
jgi:glutaredoxin 3